MGYGVGLVAKLVSAFGPYRALPMSKQSARCRIERAARMTRHLVTFVGGVLCMATASVTAGTSPPQLDKGGVGVIATPSLDAQGKLHVIGSVINSSQKRWLIVRFTCFSDNTGTDRLPSRSFDLNVRFQTPIEPGSRRHFDVQPDLTTDRRRLHDAVVRYPQAYWWRCSETTGDDTDHHTFKITPQVVPPPMLPVP